MNMISMIIYFKFKFIAYINVIHMTYNIIHIDKNLYVLTVRDGATSRVPFEVKRHFDVLALKIEKRIVA